MNEIKTITLSDFIKKAYDEDTDYCNLNYNDEVYIIEDESVFKEVKKLFVEKIRLNHMYNFILGKWFTIYNYDVNLIGYGGLDDLKNSLNLNEVSGCFRIIKD